MPKAGRYEGNAASSLRTMSVPCPYAVPGTPERLIVGERVEHG